MVHLYNLGASQRGPSLRLRFADIEALHCDYLTQHFLHVHVSDPHSHAGNEDSGSDSRYASSGASDLEGKQYELYIPAPASLSRDQAYEYHVTTRNFFAYATSQPIVGEKLSVSLINLLERIREWQPGTAALAKFTKYCQQQGYEDIAHNVDYACACLLLAERAKLRDLWIESFVHCVAMHEQLDLSPEFEGLRNTKLMALITRASLQMDLHITRVIRTLGSFLEEEMGPLHLGLAKPARDHLDRFRSFLHNYYVEKLGYFPPSHSGTWNKRLWMKMFYAFQSLYDYLADKESSNHPTNTRGVSGGICVRQHVQGFDRRHGYDPLPHPLPLLPEEPAKSRQTENQRGLRSFRLGRSDSVTNLKLSTIEALSKATNSENAEVMEYELVREYQRFERLKLEERLSASEARKVRWLLIYGILQMLISIIRAPKEVRDSETPTYPLCVITSGFPPWHDDQTPEYEDKAARINTETVLMPGTSPGEDYEISIRPDCDAESASAYFSANMSRRPYQADISMVPSPLRITSPIARAASIRSSVHSSVHALQRSLSRRSSLRRISSSRTVSTTGMPCKTLIEGYGYGTHESTQQTSLDLSTAMEAASYNPLAEFDFGLGHVNEEPVLEDCEVNCLFLAPTTEQESEWEDNVPALSDESMSPSSSSNPSSTRSSTYWPDFDTHSIEPASSSPTSKMNASFSALWQTSPKKHRFQGTGSSLGLQTTIASVHAGCYVPSGSGKEPISKCSNIHLRDWESGKRSSRSTFYKACVRADNMEDNVMLGREG